MEGMYKEVAVGKRVEEDAADIDEYKDKLSYWFKLCSC